MTLLPLVRSSTSRRYRGIGRKAHIDFLETNAYVRFLLWKQRDKFL